MSRLLVACAWALLGCASASEPAGDTDEGTGESSGEPPFICSPVAVGVELGDEVHVAGLAEWGAMPTLRDGVYVHHNSHELEPGDGLIALLQNGNRDMNNFVCASADANKFEPELVPHVYELPQCHEDYVEGFVMARFEGTGVLARLWMTLASISTGVADDDVVRIYVDDDPARRYEFPLAGMLDGTADPVFAPPFGAAATSYLAWHYPVAFSSKLVLAIDNLGANELVYHQASVVLEPVGERDCDLSEARPTALGPAPTGEVSTHAAPGSVALEGPGTIQELVVRAPDFTALLDVVVTATWDGQTAWSLPLGDLFSTRLDLPADDPTAPLRSRVVDGQTELALALPMPFSESADLTFDGGPAFEVRLTVTPDLPADPWGHLEAHPHETVGPFDGRHPVVDVTGRGRLVGTCMTLQGHADDAFGFFAGPFNFLEGDETIRIDGQEVVSGTGTEDYLDSAFYFDEGPHSGPFAQAWAIAEDLDATPPAGAVSSCRWHTLGDAMDFRTSLQMDLEIGPGAPELLDRYRSVAFVYRQR